MVEFLFKATVYICIVFVCMCTPRVHLYTDSVHLYSISVHLFCTTILYYITKSENTKVGNYHIHYCINFLYTIWLKLFAAFYF